MLVAEQADVKSEPDGPQAHASLRRSRGRPRSERVDRAISAATVELLARHGFSGLRMEQVAAAAGVSKAAVYRRWGTREALVGAVLAEATVAIEAPSTGRVRSDLLAAMRFQLGVLTAGLGRIHATLLLEASFNPALRPVVRDVTDRQRAPLAAVLERGVSAGELRADIDVTRAVDVLWGCVFSRFLRALASGEALEIDFVDAAVDDLLRGLRS